MHHLNQLVGSTLTSESIYLTGFIGFGAMHLPKRKKKSKTKLTFVCTCKVAREKNCHFIFNGSLN